MIVITLTHPESEETTHRFDLDRIRIGREADNDLVLSSDTCSRYHAEIVHERGLYKILDLDSTNGIKIGGKRVPEFVLGTGVEVTIGEYTLAFSIPQEETPKTVAIDVEAVAPAETTAAIPIPEPSPEFVYLLYRTEGRLHSVKIVAGTEYVIGRSPGADVVLDDIRCSGRHAAVSLRDGRLHVRDLGSANGTFVDSKQIKEAELGDGDRFTVGRTAIEVSGEPRDTVDEDDLLARTQLGIPQQLADSPAGPPESDRAASVPQSWAPTPGRPNLWVVGGIVLVVLIGVVLVSVWRMAGSRDTAPAAGGDVAGQAGEVIVQVRAVERKQLSFSVNAAGTVQPQRRVTVSAEVPGRVVEIPVAEGRRVARGDLLVRLDDRQIRLQIDEAASSVSREQVELARQDYERKQRLFDDGALTRSALDQAKNQYLSLDSAYKTAQARIAQLRERLGKTLVTAPIAGTVAQSLVNPGEFVAPGVPLVLVEDTDEVLVSVEVADRDVVKLRPLQVVEATTDAFPGRIFQGVVETIGTTANPVTKGFSMEARIGNPDGSLRSGMIVSLSIMLEKRSCLVVPQDALLDASEEDARVMVVSAGVARTVTVGLGSRKDRDVEVLHGLAEGDEVVVYGHDQVLEGRTVKTYRAE